MPRASISQWGAPNPVNAGTIYTPLLSFTFWAILFESAAFSNNFNSSRNHCIIAPPIKTDPSNAYVGFPLASHAIVVISPLDELILSFPVFVSKKQPVPYVHLVSPGLTQNWPKSAACWSPAIPVIGNDILNNFLSVLPKFPIEGITFGNKEIGILNILINSLSQIISWILNIRVLEALV